MKVTFTRRQVDNEMYAHWNPESGVNPGYTFILREGKWRRCGTSGNHPSAIVDVEAAWNSHLAKMVTT